MTRMCWTATLCLAACAAPGVRADEPAAWDPAAAAKYLDERATVWFGWDGAARGQGADKSACISCHTLLPYALARPVLRRRTGQKRPAEWETRLLAQTRKRVASWERLHTPALRLFYDFSKAKKRQSWGTEAVLNALVLAREDRFQGKAKPEDITRKAFEHLWQTQVRKGEFAGSSEWLNFGLDPWEADGGRYFGATLAALAVGTAPGYYTPGRDAALEESVKLLRSYLQGKFGAQNLHNRAWALWASARLLGVLTPEQRKQVIRELRDKQQADGGWRLASLGDYRRGDGAPQDPDSDGYATGFVVAALRAAGLPRDDAQVAKGLAWLRAHQEPTGAWRGNSVNRQRPRETLVGRFMSDAATAYAVLALGDP